MNKNNINILGVWAQYCGRELKKFIMRQHLKVILHSIKKLGTILDAESVGFGDKIYHDFVKAPENGAEMCKVSSLFILNYIINII